MRELQLSNTQIVHIEYQISDTATKKYSFKFARIQILLLKILLKVSTKQLRLRSRV